MKFLWRQFGMLRRFPIYRQPADDPNGAEESGKEEGKSPSQVDRDPGYGQGSDGGADVGSRVKDSRGQSPLFFRKPFRDGFDGCGKIAGLSKAQGEPSDSETQG